MFLPEGNYDRLREQTESNLTIFARNERSEMAVSESDISSPKYRTTLCLRKKVPTFKLSVTFVKS